MANPIANLRTLTYKGLPTLSHGQNDPYDVLWPILDI